MLDDDKEIIRQVLDGDIDKFEQIIEKYKRKVFSIVAKRIPNQDWNVVAQDVFINSFRSIAKFDLNKPFENWIATIAMRNCCDYWRKHWSDKKGAFDTDNVEHEEWLEAVRSVKSIEEFEKQVSRSETLEILSVVLDKLDPEDRMIVDLIYMEGWKLKEVAEVLQWNINKLKARSMRAREKMRKIVENIIDR
jgi:RNA polymerase sigma-70 factor, ECF subfamily